MDEKKAVGIDKVTKSEYGRNLDDNLECLVRWMKSGSYKPKPARRVSVEKDGSSKKRPLALSSYYEDKLIQVAVASILEPIYEPKFCGFSYGFRPHRNCHQAVREVWKDIQYHKVSYVVEADLHAFFDTLNQQMQSRLF